MKAEVMIAPVYGPIDPPPITITIKNGRHRLIRVALAPEDFALALTGRLVHGTITSGPWKDEINLKDVAGPAVDRHLAAGGKRNRFKAP